SRLGRTAFIRDAPDPLHHLRIEEANRLLEKGAPYREEATYLIRELGRTGRSVGEGIGLSAQASHLEELGGSDTLRAMLKEGEVTLLRWSSSMMRQLVSDGLLPATAQLMPIPKSLRNVELRSQFAIDADDDEEDAPGTQGMAYLLSGPHPTAMMRHFRIGSIAPTPGLDPEILALYGDDAPPTLEDASHDAAGEAYAARHDPVKMAMLCQAVYDEAQEEEDKRPAGKAGKSYSPAKPPRAAAPRIIDRVRAALANASAPMSAEDVLAAVLADGGKEVRPGSVRNALLELVNGDTDVVRADRGLYTIDR
ncbi:hypothetical protein, partial [Actinocorallia libanotica]